LRAAEGRELFLELGYILAEGEIRSLEYRLDSLMELLLERLVLRWEIDKWDLHDWLLSVAR
jgi:hypothetical protein